MELDSVKTGNRVVVVIGAGVAGLTASIAAGSRNQSYRHEGKMARKEAPGGFPRG